jgi:glycosyltransferase involved in cell wall biosynthesis
VSSPRLHIVTTVPRSIYTLLTNQPHQLSLRFDMTLIASPGPDLEASGLREGVRAHGIPMSRGITPIADLVALWRLYWWFRHEHPQIVQSYTPKAGLLAMTAACLARVPIRVHGIVGMPLMEAQGWRRHLLAAAERATYSMATNLLCNSIGLRLWVEENLSPKRVITVVGNGSINGVDLDCFRPASEELRQKERSRLGIAGDATVFVFLGRLVPAKGVAELLQTFSLLRQNHENVVLLIVGDPEAELHPLSHQAMDRIAAGGGVIHVGWRDDVRPLLAAADVCVLPSHREGLPNALLEAAASGLPALASNINGCNEVIEHGRTGLLVPAKDVQALHEGLELMLDPGIRRAMGAAARARVGALYDHKGFCRELMDWYIEALGSADVPIDRLPQPG